MYVVASVLGLTGGIKIGPGRRSELPGAATGCGAGSNKGAVMGTTTLGDEKEVRGESGTADVLGEERSGAELGMLPVGCECDSGREASWSLMANEIGVGAQEVRTSVNTVGDIGGCNAGYRGGVVVRVGEGVV